MYNCKNVAGIGKELQIFTTRAMCFSLRNFAKYTRTAIMHHYSTYVETVVPARNLLTVISYILFYLVIVSYFI